MYFEFSLPRMEWNAVAGLRLNSMLFSLLPFFAILHVWLTLTLSLYERSKLCINVRENAGPLV